MAQRDGLQAERNRHLKCLPICIEKFFDVVPAKFILRKCAAACQQKFSSQQKICLTWILDGDLTTHRAAHVGFHELSAAGNLELRRNSGVDWEYERGPTSSRFLHD
jgi:hypothetical protein